MKNSDIDNLLSEDDNQCKDEVDGFLNEGVHASWINISNTFNVKKKLIRILEDNITIFQQR